MRLIDADALKRHKQLEAQGNGQYEDIEVVYASDIDNAPTIDAYGEGYKQGRFDAEADMDYLVRCKDCIHSEAGEDSPITAMWCTRFGRLDIAVEEDGYCSFGERKGNDK